MLHMSIGYTIIIIVWRLSVAYIGPKLRTERHRKTTIGTEVTRVKRDSDATFEVKRSRSPGCFTHRRVGASASSSIGHGNVLAVRNCCYVAVCSAARGASVPTGRRGAGAYRGSRLPTACFRQLNPYHSIYIKHNTQTLKNTRTKKIK